MATVISTFSLWLDGYCDIYVFIISVAGLMATVISTFSLYQYGYCDIYVFIISVVHDGYCVFIISVA